MKSGPHQSRIGNFEPRQMLAAVRRLGGQSPTGPSAVRDQSLARMSSPISPPPCGHIAVSADRCRLSVATAGEFLADRQSRADRITAPADGQMSADADNASVAGVATARIVSRA